MKRYPQWVANIAPAKKKDEMVRMFIDFKDLNMASLKDNFLLPHMDILVDNTIGHSLISFIDGYAGYNQVKMVEEDTEKPTFINPWGNILLHYDVIWVKK